MESERGANPIVFSLVVLGWSNARVENFLRSKMAQNYGQNHPKF